MRQAKWPRAADRGRCTDRIPRRHPPTDSIPSARLQACRLRQALRIPPWDRPCGAGAAPYLHYHALHRCAPRRRTLTAPNTAAPAYTPHVLAEMPRSGRMIPAGPADWPYGAGSHKPVCAPPNQIHTLQSHGDRFRTLTAGWRIGRMQQPRRTDGLKRVQSEIPWIILYAVVRIPSAVTISMQHA